MQIRGLLQVITLTHGCCGFFGWIENGSTTHKACFLFFVDKNCGRLVLLVVMDDALFFFFWHGGIFGFLVVAPDWQAERRADAIGAVQIFKKILAASFEETRKKGE